MMRRLSSQFGRKKDKDGANSSAVNGTSPQSPSAIPEEQPKPNGVKRNSTFGLSKKKTDTDTMTNGDTSHDTAAKSAKHADEGTNRQDVESMFSQFAGLIHAAQRPLPTQTGDQTYLVEEASHSSFWQDFRSLGLKDANTLKEVALNKAGGQPQDDRTYIMERVIQLVSALPSNSQNRVNLTNTFLKELWDGLQHPPMSYMSDKHVYRQPDGSWNNPTLPWLGAAHQPYARTVPPMIMPKANLPDEGLVFDTVMAREEFKPHPNGVSSFFFNWASLVIHDLFQTSHEDFNISNTSSYLDLSILYGDSEEDQHQIRTFEDGKLKPDCWSEDRLLVFPPASGVCLIMLNRYHNYVVEQLAIINEAGRFSQPRQGLSEEARAAAIKKRDHDLFNTGRLVTCGLYINIILGDYLRTIVGLNNTDSTWALDPRAKMGPGGATSGTGNTVSVEFNLAYRWHATISQWQEEWMDQAYVDLFGKRADDLTMPELMRGLKEFDKKIPKDPLKRPFAKMQRDPTTGKYNDDELVAILTQATDDLAGAFGARHIPKCLRAITILGMKQARSWQTCSINEFRKFFHLQAHETFEQINPDPYVANQLKHLYEHPDYVELFTGLLCEDAKNTMDPGVGICPPFTLSRTVLSDAVALVRGDRFYTTDYTPIALTNWGYSTVQYDLNIEQGCCFSKLFLNAFPDHYAYNSVYARYPMTVPSHTRKVNQKVGREHDYDYAPPKRIRPRVNVTNYHTIKKILADNVTFGMCWNNTELLWPEGGQRFMLSGDQKVHKDRREQMAKCLYIQDWHKKVATFYEEITKKLLHDSACRMGDRGKPTYMVDFTRDIGNISHVHFAAETFFLPLKTEANPKGLFSSHELWQIEALIFAAIFFDLDPVKSFQLKKAGKMIGAKMAKLIESQVNLMSSTSWFAGLTDRYFENTDSLKDYGVHMVRQLLASGLSVREIVQSQILPVSGAQVANQAQVTSQILDYYTHAGAEFLPELRRLAFQDTPAADETILRYCQEAIRLNGTFGLYRQANVDTTIQDGDKTHSVKAGDKVFVGFVEAAKDPSIFPNPEKVDITRPMDAYLHYGYGPHECLGAGASRVAIAAILKTMVKCENLRPAPGPQGVLQRIPRPGGFYIYMNETGSGYSPFPQTFKLMFDGEIPAAKPAAAGK